MAVNYLATPADARPLLPTRVRVAGRIEARCPACGAWRPGFVIVPAPPGSPTGWHCDFDITRLERTGA